MHKQARTHNIISLSLERHQILSHIWGRIGRPHTISYCHEFCDGKKQKVGTRDRYYCMSILLYSYPASMSSCSICLCLIFTWYGHLSFPARMFWNSDSWNHPQNVPFTGKIKQVAAICSHYVHEKRVEAKSLNVFEFQLGLEFIMLRLINSQRYSSILLVFDFGITPSTCLTIISNFLCPHILWVSIILHY